MKKMYLVLIILQIILLCSIIIYQFYLNSVDTKYAINFSKVFNTYDIKAIDKYFVENTKIISNGKSKTYKELRKNVLVACEEKKYYLSSYGHGEDHFLNGAQNVEVILHGNFDEVVYGDINISLKLRKVGLFKFEIISLECNETIFEYLFYGTA